MSHSPPQAFPRMQNIHLPLYHHGLCPAPLSGLFPDPGGPMAVGTGATVQPGQESGFDTAMIAWYPEPDPVMPARLRIACREVARAPLAIRRAAGAAGFAVFGEGPQMEGLRAGLGSVCRGWGLATGAFHVVWLEGGIVVIDRNLGRDLPRDMTPVALRGWMQAGLGGYLALVRDRDACAETTAQFLTGVDRIVKTLLPGYLHETPDAVFEAALEGVRFLPSRHATARRPQDSSAA
ncbi:hypothetical protein [Mangrovicoccus algicola]|uniref:Uncharacterized protein n=1 Tax=Mangrovicoccus algicola TaxID=2771008 RepID=A0A8J6YSP1_9RHOB|nr:hypothetical protein [Mangrovicoccus algicola]MBE3638418.1 hypothetical protein [Mangrovicoccus algicola]